MRSDVELLRLLRSETILIHKHNLLNGLCNVIRELRYNNDISKSEDNRLTTIYIQYAETRTRFYRPFGTVTCNDYWYAWKRGQLEPRLKWIDAQIKKRTKK